MTQYEVFIDQVSQVETILRINADESVSYIPTDPANSDYQRYLKWLENPEVEGTQPTL